MVQRTDDLRIEELRPLISPAILIEELPITPEIESLVESSRKAAGDILLGTDDRLIAIVGPCSIHDTTAALEYAQKLSGLANELKNDIHIIMRVYFEKPRTTIGWKGLINDPGLDNSFAINKGLRAARQLLIGLNELGITAGTEFLDTIIPQFISDLIAWGAIGARTTESQIHRELASGLSMPVGFKNGTGGNIQIALDAVGSARHPHRFLGVTKDGLPAIVHTTGNSLCHIILRGAKSGPNYDNKTINETHQSLIENSLTAGIIIDCSHGNSSKDYKRQPIVAGDLAKEIANGNRAICGVMLESNLVAGNQKLTPDTQLTYGQSVTDACISWDTTIDVLHQLANAVRERRKT